MKYTPHTYQDHATQHIIGHPASGLFLDMGLGKTISTLTAIDILMNALFEITKVLVIAPKRVAEDVWTAEAQKWDHVRHFRFSKILGTEVQRKAALKQDADIYLINRENIVWLVAQLGGSWPFDMVVIDELSSFKDPSSARFKALRQVRPKADRIVGLTGTPAPNSLLDLWPQLYLLDMGERLGRTVTGYREKFFIKNYNGYGYELRKESGIIGEDYYEKKIYEKIGDICISMKKEDWLELPERVNNYIDIRLQPEVLKKYQQFERDQVLAMNEQENITAINAGVLTGKLLQFANGAVYDENRVWHEVHRQKLEALEEVIEAANGQPVLIAYNFKHDLERIQQHLKRHKVTELKGSKEIQLWNEGKIRVMAVHPASAGHGLNLQKGGHIIVWFGLVWSLELYQQLNTRLDRQGQEHAVIVHHLVARGTMDEDVIRALDKKEAGQEALMQAVKARIHKYRKTVTV